MIYEDNRQEKFMFPDFFIAGAMKAGTSTLHPELCMSEPKEPFILGREDIRLYKSCFFEQPQEWLDYDWDTYKQGLTEKYGAVFADAETNCLTQFRL